MSLIVWQKYFCKYFWSLIYMVYNLQILFVFVNVLIHSKSPIIALDADSLKELRWMQNGSKVWTSLIYRLYLSPSLDMYK